MCQPLRLIVVVTTLLVLFAAHPPMGAARTAPRPLRARVELDVSVFERGVSVVHSRHTSLTFALDIGRRSHATLRVTGTGHRSSMTLSPGGDSAPSERAYAVDDVFSGTFTRTSGIYTFAFTRVGEAHAPPLEWRCESATDVLAAHPQALRCVGTAALDPLPWHNGDWSQVPVVVADDDPQNDITWDGESTPRATVR